MRNIVLGATFVLWLCLSAVVYLRLVSQAATAAHGTIEEYARSPGFQLLNFAIGNLPFLVALLAVVLVIEFFVFKMLDRRFNRRAMGPSG